MPYYRAASDHGEGIAEALFFLVGLTISLLRPPIAGSRLRQRCMDRDDECEDAERLQ